MDELLLLHSIPVKKRKNPEGHSAETQAAMEKTAIVSAAAAVPTDKFPRP